MVPIVSDRRRLAVGVVHRTLTFIRFNWNRASRGLHTAFAVAIIASTVLVKQHYVVDLAAGAMVYGLARTFLTRLGLMSSEQARALVGRHRGSRPISEPAECGSGTAATTRPAASD